MCTTCGCGAGEARVEGDTAARGFLRERGDPSAEGEILVAEINFCEGGCAVDLEG